MNITRIGIIGFGEVGKIFGAGLAALPSVATVSTWDKKGAQGTGMVEAASARNVIWCDDAAAVYANADLIISAVTASNTTDVAETAAAYIQPGSIFLDLNSASPGTKKACAQRIENAGAHYVEAGVMTSVPPYGIKVPMLLGGALAPELSEHLNAWGFDTAVANTTLGIASAIKMSRSVMIKGLEALVIESFATARVYGVERQMLATLKETFPGIDWEKQGAYFFTRVAQHGQRRAEEMRESANTVAEAGFEPFMTQSIADKQQWMADAAKAGVFKDIPSDAPWEVFADALISARRA